MPPADIKFEEFCKTAIESARKGFYLQSSQVDQAVADFLRQYDWVVALWPEARNPSGMGVSIIRDSGKKTGFSRCNSIPCADRETALNYTPCAAAPTTTHLTRPPPIQRKISQPTLPTRGYCSPCNRSARARATDLKRQSTRRRQHKGGAVLANPIMTWGRA
jgi:hypothetical protein